MTSSFDLSKILGRVRALIERAEHPSANPNEAAACHAKAEQLMRTYRIQEEELLAADVDTAIEPVKLTIRLGMHEKDAYIGHIVSLLWSAAEHSGCRVANDWIYSNDAPTGESWELVSSLVGYQGDARYAEMLFTSARLVWSTHVDPKVDPKLSEPENVYLLRNSGLSRASVATMMWGSGRKDGAAHGKVQKIYLAECARRGEDPKVAGRSVSASTFREVFAQAFAIEFGSRLYRARQATDNASRPLELHGRKERVEEKFYQLFPKYRPAKSDPQGANKKPAKERRITKAQRERYERTCLSPTAQLAQKAGREAASKVPLRGEEKIVRLDGNSDQGQLGA